MNCRTTITGAVFALLGLAFSASPAVALDDLTLNVAPGSQAVMPGDTVTVTLQAANLSTPINGAQALLHYDDTILALVNIIPTNLGLVPPSEGWVEIAEEDTGGDVDWAAAINGGAILIDHTIATLVFTAIGEGTTNVIFLPDADPFFTKLTAAPDNTTILPNTTDSGQRASFCDDGVFCNGVELFTGGVCVPGEDPCVPLLCDEDNNTCIPAPRVSGLEVFYAGRFSDDPDPSRSYLAAGSVATTENITNYLHGITGIRILFDDVVDFATTARDALAFEWTTGTGTTFSEVTDADTAISASSTVEGGGTTVTVFIDDDHVKRRWLKVTVDSSAVSSGGVALDGELAGAPIAFPSGDSAPGGDAVFYLGNIGGEVDGNRKTNITDVGIIRTMVNPFQQVLITNVYDIDKDGKVLITDVGEARVEVNPFFTLPAIAP